MSATLEPSTKPAESQEIDVHSFEHHWQDEADAAYLYRLLAAAEPDAKKRDIYSRLADVEDRHVVVWADLLEKHGHRPAKFRPSRRAKLLAALGRWFGPGFLLPMLLEEEGREVKAYLDMHRETPIGAPGGLEALTLARESAEHATTLGEISGKGGEPWHKTASGGFLRNVVYGFNDGLTANFGLVAGVIGAATINQHQAVVVAGVAGLIADALSMGSSGYLASKSEREVYDYEISMEKTEVELMPEIERDELAIIYETKGMDRESAHALATRIMADPGADAEGAGAGRAQDRRVQTCRPSAKAGSPGSRLRSARRFQCFPFSSGTVLPRSSFRSRLRCCRTSSSAPRDRCSPDGEFSAPASTCLSSVSVWPALATSSAGGSEGCSSVPSRPYILAETNWKSVKDTTFEVAVLPWGATEPHNYHLPYATDNYETGAIAERAAEIAWNKGAKVVLFPQFRSA